LFNKAGVKRLRGRKSRVANPGKYPISWGSQRASDPTVTVEGVTADERKPSGQRFPICRLSVLVLYVKFRKERLQANLFHSDRVGGLEEGRQQIPCLDTSHKNQ
jgi:hypothetical protein